MVFCSHHCWKRTTGNREKREDETHIAFTRAHPSRPKHEGLLIEMAEVVASVWIGLTSVVGDDGRVGWVEPIGAAPAAVREGNRADYGAGAFLLAAGKVARLTSGP